LFKAFSVLIIVLPLAIWFLIDIVRIKRASEENIYVCPNCSHRFKAKWKQMILPSNLGILIPFYNTVKTEMIHLKCPKCNIRDICKKPYDQQ